MTDATRPLVTLCLITRNRAGLLRRALPTILSQDYAPLDILISDNCSNDETESICREVAARDPRVRYVRHQTNLGLYGNHNFCLNESRGEFVCLWHDDDEHDVSLVGRYVRFMLDHPTVGVVCAAYTLIDEDDKVLGVRNRVIKEVTPGQEYIAQTFNSGQSSVLVPGAMIRRSALGATRFEEHGPLGFADFVVWFAIAEHHDIGYIGERLWTYRLHRASLSRRKIWEIVGDYEFHLGGYCAARLAKGPDREVERWRSVLDRFLFWALIYELSLHLRRRTSTEDSGRYRTVFDIANYRLEPEEVTEALRLLKRYQRGPLQGLVLIGTTGMVRLGLRWPLGWAAEHVGLWRRVIGLQ